MKNAQDSWFISWPDGLIGIDNNKRIVEFSPAASKILGWSAEEVYDCKIHEVLCTISRSFQHPVHDCELVKLAPKTNVQSTLWRHKSGNYISVDYRIMPVAYLEATTFISFIDNSTRKYNQSELEKFSEYVDLSPSPLGEFFLDGQLLFGNQALQNLMLDAGFDRDGTCMAMPKNIRQIGENLQKNQHSHEVAEIHINERVFLWHFHVLNKTADVTIVGYAFDVTAQHTAERMAAEQSQLARREFYAKMVHELRSPLNAIVGFSDLLLDDLKDTLSAEDRERLQLIKNAGNQLNEHVTATLDVAKIEAGKMQLNISEFSVAELADRVHAQMLPLAEEKQLQFQLTALTSERIFSDQSKVRQIVVNLVSNAIKYTQTGSVELLVEIKVDAELGECIRICVSDTGIGIPEDQIPRLFRSFEQIDDEQTRNIEGTGLGLSLVHNLSTLMGGKVGVKSVYGAGSAFEFLLPFANRERLGLRS